MISYWSSRHGHACPAINYFKVTFLGTFTIWLESVLYLSGCCMSCILFQSIFNPCNPLQQIGRRETFYQCQNVVLNTKTEPLFWNSIDEFNYCLHQWERHSWECWQRRESIWHGIIRLLFRECSPLRIRSSFKRFLYCGFRVLGVVQSTKCFVLKWETACRFSSRVVRFFFFYLDTDFVDILFPVPSPFSQTYLIGVFQKPHKGIQGF